MEQSCSLCRELSREVFSLLDTGQGGKGLGEMVNSVLKLELPQEGVVCGSCRESVVTKDKKMRRWLDGLPELCPRLERVDKEEESVCGEGRCAVCDTALGRGEGGEREALKALLGEGGESCQGLGEQCCQGCLALVTQWDVARQEVARLEEQVLDQYRAARDMREERFLHGQSILPTSSTCQLWLGGLQVQLVTDSPGGQVYSSLPPAPALPPPPGPITVPALLPRAALYIRPQQASSLVVALWEDRPVYCLQAILALRPRFSLGPGGRELQLHSGQLLGSSSPVEEVEGELLEEPLEELGCQECSFTTPYFHLLLPHLASHADLVAKKPSTTRTSPSHRLECSQCGKLFKKPEVLEAHMKKEHNGNTTPWECSLCGKGFTRKASMEEHMARHQGRKQRHCVPCDKYFYDTAFWRHQTTVHPETERLRFPCPYCFRVFSQRFKMEQHSQSHMDYSQKKFLCEECPDKRFASAEKLRNHRRVVHDTKAVGSHLCGTCGATFSSAPSLYQHDRRAHGDICPDGQVDAANPDSSAVLPCVKCDLAFATAAELEAHMEREHVRQPFICGFQDCDLDFRSIQELQEHQVTRHQGQVEEEQEGDSVIYVGDIGEEREEEAIVQEAEAAGLELQLYTREGRQEGQGVNIDINEENTIILTEDQGKELIKALNIEMADSGQTYPCSVCDKVYRSERSRTVHVRSVHLQQRPFECTSCGKTFACQNYLTEHSKIHEDVLRHTCTLCGKTFSTAKVLKRHFRIHTGERPFKCEFCDKTFAAASNLSEHRTLHTGRLPYTCAGCGGKFRLWTSLKKHSVKCEGAMGGGVKAEDTKCEIVAGISEYEEKEVA